MKASALITDSPLTGRTPLRVPSAREGVCVCLRRGNKQPPAAAAAAAAEATARRLQPGQHGVQD